MADIKVKLGVDGISQFKSDMNKADQAVKTLDSELKLAEANYKKTGNASEFLRTKTRVLSQQIKEQQNAVKASENALKAMAKSGDTTSVAYQKMAQKVAEAKAKLVTLETQTKNIRSSLKETTEESKGFQEQLDKIAKFTGFNAIATGFKGVASVITSCVNTIKSAISSAISAELNAAQQADDIATKARNYGVSTETYQRMTYASEQLDVPVDAFLAAQKRLLKYYNSDDPWISTEDGISVPTMYNGKYRNTEEVFWEVMQQIGVIARTDETKADKIAQEFFGRSYTDLSGFMGEGARNDWNAAMAKASVNSEQDIQTLTELNNEVDLLQNKLEVLSLKFAAKFAGASAEGVDTVEGLVDYLSEWLDGPEATELFNQINKLITDASKFVTEWIKDGGITNTLNTISDVVKWIYEFITGKSIDNPDGKPDHTTANDIVTAVQVGAGAVVVGKAVKTGIDIASKLSQWSAARQAASGVGEVVTQATGASAAAEGASWITKVGNGASKVGEFLVNWGPEMLGVAGLAFIMKAESEYEKVKDDPRFQAEAAMQFHSMRTGNRTAVIYPDASEMEIEQMRMTAASLALIEQERMHDAVQAERGYEQLVYALYQKGALAEIPTWETKQAYYGKGGINGEWGTGLDWRDYLTENYMNGTVDYSDEWIKQGNNNSHGSGSGGYFYSEDNSVKVESMTVYTSETGDEFLTSIRKHNIGVAGNK